MRSILILLLCLVSCRDNIQKEEDKYPNIPLFPLFSNDSLTYKKLAVSTVSFIKYKYQTINGNDLAVINADFFFYTYTDNSLFILTGYRESEKPGTEYPAKNFISLLRVKNNKIEKQNWMEICQQEIVIQKNGNKLYIGNKSIDLIASKLSVKKDSFYSYETPIDNNKISSWDFYSEKQKNYKFYDSTYVKEFDRIAINSEGKMSGGVNNGFYWMNDTVPLIYYKIHSKGKMGLTKINFDEQKPPILIKIQDRVYCITYDVPIDLDSKIVNYEIGTLE